MLRATREWGETAVMKEEARVMLPAKEKTTVGGFCGGSPTNFNESRG